MPKAGWISIAAVVLLAGSAVAQDRKDTESATAPTAKQSAPADSSHASGHDVQTGKPETGEGNPGEKQGAPAAKKQGANDKNGAKEMDEAISGSKK